MQHFTFHSATRARAQAPALTRLARALPLAALLALGGHTATAQPGAAPQPAAGERAAGSPAPGRPLTATAPAGSAATAPSPGASAASAAPVVSPAAPPPDMRPVWEALQKAGIQESQVALLAQPLVAGSPALVSHNERLLFTLASTTKVVTTLAGLQLLPSTFRWHTRAWLGGPLESGTLNGDLILVGGGDATLSSKKLVAWFKRLQQKGVGTVQGNLVLDQSMFRMTEKEHARTPVPEAGRAHHARPDALVVDDTLFRVQLSLDDQQKVQARFDPPLAGVELDATKLTVAPGRCNPDADFEPVDGKPRVVLTGGWNPRCAAVLELEAAPGRALTAAVVAGAWQAAGGTLTGSVLNKDPAPPAAPPRGKRAKPLRFPTSPYAGKPFDTLSSAPLPELVRTINKESHNLMARNLLMSIAPGFSPTASTLDLARQRIGGWFKKIGLGDDAPKLDNGSGLAYTEQGSAFSLVQLLQGAWNDPKTQKVFLASLPVAGADGTLAGRFKGSPAQRNAFLKTGTLSTVRSLAGYVRGKSGRMHAVAIIVNSEKAPASTPALDKFIEWVVQYG